MSRSFIIGIRISKCRTRKTDKMLFLLEFLYTNWNFSVVSTIPDSQFRLIDMMFTYSLQEILQHGAYESVMVMVAFFDHHSSSRLAWWKHRTVQTNMKNEVNSMNMAPVPIKSACLSMMGMARLPTADAPVRNFAASIQLRGESKSKSESESDKEKYVYHVQMVKLKRWGKK